MKEMTKIPDIYVIQHPSRKGVPLDITDAAKFGKLQEPIFSSRYNTLLDTTDAVGKMEQGLLHYTSEDFIIAIGDPILIGMAMAIGARNAAGIVRMLKWNRLLNTNGTRNHSVGNYIPVNVEMDIQ